MSARHLILCLAVALTGCASAPPDDAAFQAQPLPDAHTATQDAARDCGGPFLEWGSLTKTSKWPYRVEVAETFRCLNDGRVVGPYSYEEGL